MDLQEVVGSLTEEQKSVVLSAIEAEKVRGIDESRRKGAESAKLRSENIKFRDAIKNTFEVDLNSVDELPDVLSKFKTQTVNRNDYVPTKDFESLKKQIAEERSQREKAEANLRNSKLAERLTQVYGDTFHARDLLIQQQIASGSVRLTDSGDVVYVEGDDEIDITKGMEVLKKKRPDLVKNNTRAGGGSSAGTKDKNIKEMTLDDFNALSGKDRVKIMSEGYKLT